MLHSSNSTGVIKFLCKKSWKEINHAMSNARNSYFSAFSNKSKLSCDALKFKFRCTKIYVLTRDQDIFGQNKFKLVITCQNVNFSASKLKF